MSDATRRRLRQVLVEVLETVSRWDAMNNLLSNTLLLLVNKSSQYQQPGGDSWEALGSHEALQIMLKAKLHEELSLYETTLVQRHTDLIGIYCKLKASLEAIFSLCVEADNLLGSAWVTDTPVLRTCTLQCSALLVERIANAYAQELVLKKTVVDEVLRRHSSRDGSLTHLDIVSLQPIVGSREVQEALEIIRFELGDL